MGNYKIWDCQLEYYNDDLGSFKTEQEALKIYGEQLRKQNTQRASNLSNKELFELYGYEVHNTTKTNEGDLKMTNQTYFTKLEALEEIKEMLQNGYNDYYCDLHSAVFNTSYYATTNEEAKENLEQYGFFEAIGKIMEYEKEQFGEIFTKLDEPMSVANMLWYIVGDEAIEKTNGLLEKIEENTDIDLWNSEATQEVNEKLLHFLDIEIEEEMQIENS